MLLLTILLWNGGPVMAQDAKHHAKHAVELGWGYFQKGDMDTALKRFNQALILDSDFAPGYFGIAYGRSEQLNILSRSDMIFWRFQILTLTCLF